MNRLNNQEQNDDAERVLSKGMCKVIIVSWRTVETRGLASLYFSRQRFGQ
jgi:hypothetical protein